MRTTLRVLLAAVVVCLLGPPADVLAIPDDNRPPGLPNCNDPSVHYSATLSVAPVVVGQPLAGGTVQVNAANAKVTATNLYCPTKILAVSSFSWSVSGGTPRLPAVLTGATTLIPSVRLGAAGDYQVRLTLCPHDCTVPVGNKPFPVLKPTTVTVPIRALNEIALQPDTEPAVRDFRADETCWPDQRPCVTEPQEFSDRESKCQDGGGFSDPAWVTTDRFDGPGDYELVEGRVGRSRIASTDNRLNHYTQDEDFAIRPDLPYRRLVSRHPEFSSDPELLAVEWESKYFPRGGWPTVGDRASAIGYWIFDCGHQPFYTEIHPPVLTAVARSRPVEIPSSFHPPGFPNGMGSNVFVPGIVVDLRVNRRSGEITSNCSTTGLHQPSVGLGDGPCIREPHGVNRRFEFNVFLPRDPQVRMVQDAGVATPPVPLFVDSGSGGPEPQIVQEHGRGLTWLQVTVDLTGFTDTTYRRRIVAAWAQPAANNWGLRRWRIGLRAIDVHDDQDSGPKGDGDWRWFFNTNNRDQEWTRVINCNQCVHGARQFQSGVATGSLLGPDPLVFPDQSILVHTTGFDDDTFSDDDTGSVNKLISQRAASAACRDKGCHWLFRSDGSQYDLSVDIRPGAPVGSASLTVEALVLANAYVLRASCAVLPSGCFAPIAPSQVPTLGDTFDARDLVLSRRAQPLPLSRLPIFERHEREEYQLNGISIRLLRRNVAEMRRRDPDGLRRLLPELRSEIAGVPRALRPELYPLAFALQRALRPSELRAALPRYARLGKLRPFPIHDVG
jgi:hypothetical protein